MTVGAWLVDLDGTLYRSLPVQRVRGLHLALTYSRTRKSLLTCRDAEAFLERTGFRLPTETEWIAAFWRVNDREGPILDYRSPRATGVFEICGERGWQTPGSTTPSGEWWLLRSDNVHGNLVDPVWRPIGSWPEKTSEQWDWAMILFPDTPVLYVRLRVARDP